MTLSRPLQYSYVMSFGNAVRQREEMITNYQAILKTETSLDRIADIKKQISLCEDEITELKKGKPLFGRPKPLVKESRLIESNPEKPGEQKVTILNPQPTPVTPTPPTATPKPTRLENSLRSKIQAAKAAKK